MNNEPECRILQLFRGRVLGGACLSIVLVFAPPRGAGSQERADSALQAEAETLAARHVFTTRKNALARWALDPRIFVTDPAFVRVDRTAQQGSPARPFTSEVPRHHTAAHLNLIANILGGIPLVDDSTRCGAQRLDECRIPDGRDGVIAFSAAWTTQDTLRLTMHMVARSVPTRSSGAVTRRRAMLETYFFIFRRSTSGLILLRVDHEVT